MVDTANKKQRKRHLKAERAKNLSSRPPKTQKYLTAKGQTTLSPLEYINELEDPIGFSSTSQELHMHQAQDFNFRFIDAVESKYKDWPYKKQI